jgi:diketogulonate reductase-like aldo/keto reductase
MFSQHILLLAFAILIFYSSSEGGPINEQPYVRLMNAVHGEVLMPVVGLGTGGYGNSSGEGGEVWDPEQGHNATVAWLKLGGRRIDSADNYKSQPGIGTGWIASGIPRSEIFITSKVSTSTYAETMELFDGVLESLQTDYVDLLLIHGPGSQPTVPGPYPPCREGKSTWTDCRIETWRALQTLFDQRRVRIL